MTFADGTICTLCPAKYRQKTDVSGLTPMIARNQVKPLDATLEQESTSLLGVKLLEKNRLPKAIKSPLRYPGGKSRAVNHILDLLPSDLDRLCSPFVGGASVELACTVRGVDVHAYDAFQPLVNFWQVLLDDAPALAQLVKSHYPISKTQFYALQRRYFRFRNPRKLAAIFFALNRSSFSGTTLSGGMSPGHPRFTPRTIENLANFQADSFSVKLADFRDSMREHKHDFLYLDPPYANGGKLYGERGDCHADFDHAALAKLLYKRDSWLLSYNDCPAVRELYKDFRILPCSWSYGMNASKESNEVFIIIEEIIYQFLLGVIKGTTRKSWQNHFCPRGNPHIFLILGACGYNGRNVIGCLVDFA